MPKAASPVSRIMDTSNFGFGSAGRDNMRANFGYNTVGRRSVRSDHSLAPFNWRNLYEQSPSAKRVREEEDDGDM